jgi:hypothetical protein
MRIQSNKDKVIARLEQNMKDFLYTPDKVKLYVTSNKIPHTLDAKGNVVSIDSEGYRNGIVQEANGERFQEAWGELDTYGLLTQLNSATAAQDVEGIKDVYNTLKSVYENVETPARPPTGQSTRARLSDMKDPDLQRILADMQPIFDQYPTKSREQTAALRAYAASVQNHPKYSVVITADGDFDIVPKTNTSTNTTPVSQKHNIRLQ